MLEELVQPVGLEDALWFVGEEDGVSIEGHSQLGLRHLGHLLWHEHGGRGNAWVRTDVRGIDQSEFDGAYSPQNVAASDAATFTLSDLMHNNSSATRPAKGEQNQQRNSEKISRNIDFDFYKRNFCYKFGTGMQLKERQGAYFLQENKDL